MVLLEWTILIIMKLFLGLQRHHYEIQQMDNHIAKLNTKLVKKEETLTELQQKLSEKEEIIANQGKVLNYFTQEQLLTGKQLG